MIKGERLWQRFAENTDLSEEYLPGNTIVEIAGENRVLIERHLGVKGYSHECIIVKVKFGYIHVCGSCLELCRMTSEQLVIKGRIDQVSLQRRS